MESLELDIAFDLHEILALQRLLEKLAPDKLRIQLIQRHSATKQGGG